MPAATAKVIKFFGEKKPDGTLQTGQIAVIKREWDQLSETSQTQLINGIADETYNY